MYKLGEKISNLRKKEGLTQAGLAEKIGVSAQAVSKWEIGASYPDISVMPKLAKILSTTTDYLLIDEAQPETVYQKEEYRKPLDELIMKIRILDDGDKVKVNLPFAFMKMGSGFMENMNVNGNNLGDMLKGVDMDLIFEMAEKGMLGKFVEIEGKDGEHISISVE